MAKAKITPAGVPTRAEFREVIRRSLAERGSRFRALCVAEMADELADEVLALVLDRRRKYNAARRRVERSRAA